jgi:hypothetical protein
MEILNHDQKRIAVVFNQLKNKSFRKHWDVLTFRYCRQRPNGVFVKARSLLRNAGGKVVEKNTCLTIRRINFVPGDLSLAAACEISREGGLAGSGAPTN